ncbi:hypothetical protein [Deefgea sp. CFH1-16]|uniref:hypothetical protein n=1 Tax=Deefgea sp. CFH1-16 TaxID=2675457 RepID=UPI001FFC700D|nr:hypothetical protein [Deefgea sp. CFH1-16]
MPSSQVYPVSAQKALLAKVQNDDVLLQKSCLSVLERALSDDLLPGKQDIVRDATQTEVEDLVSAIRSILQARQDGVQEQLAELTGLRGKNQDVIAQMMVKVSEDKKHTLNKV